MTRQQADLAFIGTKGTVLPVSTRARICARARRRNRSARHWRCVVQEGPTDKSRDVSQLEGAVPFDKFDAGLEAALSKGWDKLDNFDGSIDSDEALQTITPDDDDEVHIHSAETSNVLTSDTNSVMMEDPKAPLSAESSAEERNLLHAADMKAKTKKKRRTRKKPSQRKLMTDLELKKSEKWSNEPRWYFVQVKPGCEQSTAASLRNLSHSLGTSQILEVLVPTTTIMRLTKGGKSVKKEERFFPSYILVLMVMSRRNYSEILAVPNVQVFMGDPNRDKKKDAPLRPPLPVKDAEMKNVFERIEEAESAKPEIKTTIRPGDSVKVIAGSFIDSMGTVLEVKPDLNVVKASLFIFGRETAVDLEFNQVEVVENMKIPERQDDEGETDTLETGQTHIGKGKSIPAGAATSAGVTSPEDDLAALLEETEDDDSEFNEDSDGNESDAELSHADDDGYGEADIISDVDDDGFSSAELDRDESEETESNDPVAKKTTGLISSDDELADLLSEDFSNSSEWSSDSDSQESEQPEDLDEFFSSLDDLDDSEDSDEEDSLLDDTETTDERVLNEREEREISDVELMRRMEEPLSEEDDHDDMGFGGEAILAEVDEMMAEVAAGKRKIGPSEEHHDLSQPIITTDEEIPEVDFFAMPDIDAHNDPDTTAPPAPKRR